MRRTALLSALWVAAAGALAGCGGGKLTDQALLSQLDRIKSATTQYQDVGKAINDGYLPTPKCIKAQDGSGSLGRPYVNGQLAAVGAVNLLTPPELLYEPQPNGPPQLVGVAYTLPDTGQRAPDIGIGRMDGPFPGAVKGQPPHFQIVAWVWRSNPKGVFDQFNADVHCP